MNVLVIGASGVVGRQLVPQLVAAGHSVTATTHTSTLDAAAEVVHRRLDLLDPAAVTDLILTLRPDAIVHEATALSGLSSNMRRFDATFAVTNRLRTEGTANLIAAASQIGSPRLIAQSFCGWPWAQVGGPVKSEDDPLDPEPAASFRHTFDAIGTLESLVADYPNGVVLRYGGLYGPGTSLEPPDGEHYRAIRRGLFPLVGDGAGVWSFLHVHDAATAAVAALHRGHGIYNIVDDEPAEVREWLPELARLAGARPPRHVPVWLARLLGGEGLVRLTTQVRGSSNAKAKAELGWRPERPSWRTGFAEEFSARTTAQGSPA